MPNSNEEKDTPLSVFDFKFDNESVYLVSMTNHSNPRSTQMSKRNINDLIAHFILERPEPKKHLYERKQPLKMLIGKFDTR